jgi:Fe-S cluster assembly protein SufD
MFTEISNETKKLYQITKPGDYIFYFENKIGEITFDISNSEATVKIYGLYQCINNDKFKLSIKQNHTAPNSTSTVFIKSILKNKSSLNITSTITISKNATKTNAHFTNRNLLLHKNSHAIISPQLEVIPGNVECTHATTTAPLNQKQLNYLIMRGISNLEARKLLINGFINDIKKYSL